MKYWPKNKNFWKYLFFYLDKNEIIFFLYIDILIFFIYYLYLHEFGHIIFHFYLDKFCITLLFISKPIELIIVKIIPLCKNFEIGKWVLFRLFPLIIKHLTVNNFQNILEDDKFFDVIFIYFLQMYTDNGSFVRVYIYTDYFRLNLTKACACLQT
jgi:hypothetical protein